MKKMPLLLISMLIVGSLILSACQIPFITVVRGSGNLTSETRSVSGFDAITLDGAGRLVITQGTTESLEIEAEDNILKELTSEVRDKTLVLGFQDQPWRTTLLPTKGIIYRLAVKDLTAVTINGAGDLEMDSLETDSLDVTINGASQIQIKALQAEKLSVEISGTGTITLGGEVSTQSVKIDGAGNYQAEDLQTQSTVIDINGLGNGTVWATDTLDITIDGGGSLRFYGSPAVTQEINGLGNIDNLGEK